MLFTFIFSDVEQSKRVVDELKASIWNLSSGVVSFFRCMRPRWEYFDVVGFSIFWVHFRWLTIGSVVKRRVSCVRIDWNRCPSVIFLHWKGERGEWRCRWIEIFNEKSSRTFLKGWRCLVNFFNLLLKIHFNRWFDFLDFDSFYF